MQEINTSQAPKAIGPYSQAIKTGNMIYTSGQIPLNPETGEVVAEGIEQQTKQVIANLSAVLAQGGATLKNVVKTTVFLKNMAEFAQFNAVYAEYFVAPFPARSTVEVARLPKDVLVEIEAIAIID